MHEDQGLEIITAVKSHTAAYSSWVTKGICNKRALTYKALWRLQTYRPSCCRPHFGSPQHKGNSKGLGAESFQVPAGIAEAIAAKSEAGTALSACQCLGRS